MNQVKELTLAEAIKQAKRPYVYAVIVESGRDFPVLQKIGPRVCSFYGSEFYVNNKKAAFILRNELRRRHPHCIYSVVKIELLSSKGK